MEGTNKRSKERQEMEGRVRLHMASRSPSLNSPEALNKAACQILPVKGHFLAEQFDWRLFNWMFTVWPQKGGCRSQSHTIFKSLERRYYTSGCHSFTGQCSLRKYVLKDLGLMCSQTELKLNLKPNVWLLPLLEPFAASIQMWLNPPSSGY